MYTDCNDPNLPDYVKHNDESTRQQWVDVFNLVLNESGNEELAFAIANTLLEKLSELRAGQQSKSTAEDNDLPDSAFLYIEPGGEKDEEGKTVPRSLRHLPYRRADGSVDLDRLRNAIARLSQRETGEVAGERWLTDELREELLERARKLLNKSASTPLIVYKSADDKLRWAAISNVAVQDKDWETITEQAYDDAIRHAQETGEFGPLDLVHLYGTEVGDCDFMCRIGKMLVEGGTWRDTDLARRVIKRIEQDPDYWGVSITFSYDPSKFVDGRYLGNIRVHRRAILPRDMAASYGTRFALQKEKGEFTMRPDTIQALQMLGLTEDEIAALAEKQEVAQTELKSKEAGEQPNFWERLVNVFKRTTDERPDTSELVNDISAAVVAQLSEREKRFSDRISQIESVVAKLTEQFGALHAEFQQTQKSVEDRALELLEQLPRVVKVQRTELPAIGTDNRTTMTDEIARAVESVLRPRL